MLGSPQAVGIQTSSGPSTPWLIPSPAFTALSSPLFVIFLLLSHNTSTAPLLSRLPVSRRSSVSTASARARTNICQQNKSLTWHPGIFFSFAATWREYKGTKQSCACHVSASKETIISSWHEDAAF